MKVKALINLHFKGTVIEEGNLFEVTKDEFEKMNKRYVEQVTAPAPEPKKEIKNEGVKNDG